MSEIIRDIIPFLLKQWAKANEEFKYPVIIHEETIFLRLKKLWIEGVKFSQGRGKLKEKEQFVRKLDKLQDILSCKCPIQFCFKVGCFKVGTHKCKQSAHTKCNCVKELKIPKIELEFIGVREIRMVAMAAC